MWHVGIDLHRTTVVLAAVNDIGEAMNPISIPCSDTAAILDVVKTFGAFRAVIEATETYRWLYDLSAASRHRPLGPPVASAGHDTTPLQNRQARRPVAGQSPANQPDSFGLHPAGTLPAVADLTRGRARLGRRLAEVD